MLANDRIAARFVKHLLEDNSGLESFDVELIDPCDLEPIANELAKRGWTTVRHPIRPRLTVKQAA